MLDKLTSFRLLYGDFLNEALLWPDFRNFRPLFFNLLTLNYLRFSFLKEP